MKLGRRSRGSGGSSPRENTASRGEADQGSAKLGRRRVATGANHPASHSSAFRRGPGTPAGAPTGDQSTVMHVTPKPPLVRQDRITIGAHCTPGLSLSISRFLAAFWPMITASKGRRVLRAVGRPSGARVEALFAWDMPYWQGGGIGAQNPRGAGVGAP